MSIGRPVARFTFAFLLMLQIDITKLHQMSDQLTEQLKDCVNEAEEQSMLNSNKVTE